ncbi:MAG: hypothetical protein KF770_06290 [Anaerolineae bacterium]|nr:hypothetical protein [Anaerolineae bacterium]
MAAYSLETVLLKWEKGELSPEQAIGQTLLLVQELAERVGNVEKRLMGSRPLAEQRPSPEPRPPSPKDTL